MIKECRGLVATGTDEATRGRQPSLPVRQPTGPLGEGTRRHGIWHKITVGGTNSERRTATAQARKGHVYSISGRSKKRKRIYAETNVNV